ncbi:DNA polymerase III subunit beta [Peribacillus deserti]|uniref:Beta sliding clamp n=1 Tax=Peribacillus deserti TaxID=673318 RepID=A0A2N5M0J0_9BACI|nr:DNA polymerase III subunit beta [Peribacillus deserti]PLT27879.1 DNA polymerase III subunit beta [Peribacillus deserti]
MELLINQEYFIKAIADVSRAVTSSKNGMSGIKVAACKDSITLTGSNSEMAIEKVIPQAMAESKLFEIYQSGSVILPTKYLYEIVKKMPGDLIMKVHEDFTVTITSGEIRSRLNGWDSGDYPNLPAIENARSFTVPSLELIKLIKHTVFAVSRNQFKPVLTGVYLSVKPNSLFFAATDSYRLAVSKLEIQCDEEGSFVVSSESMNEAARLMSQASGETAIYFTDQYIVFKKDSITLYSRLIEGVFPDINGILQIPSKTQIIIDKKKFLNGVERACLFAREGKNNNVNLFIRSDSSIRIYSDLTEIGGIEETLKTVSIEGETDFGISVDGIYIVEALKAIREETVSIKFGGVLRPVLIEPLHNDSHRHLVSPVRTR